MPRGGAPHALGRWGTRKDHVNGPAITHRAQSTGAAILTGSPAPRSRSVPASSPSRTLFERGSPRAAAYRSACTQKKGPLDVLADEAGTQLGRPQPLAAFPRSLTSARRSVYRTGAGDDRSRNASSPRWQTAVPRTLLSRPRGGRSRRSCRASAPLACSPSSPLVGPQHDRRAGRQPRRPALTGAASLDCARRCGGCARADQAGPRAQGRRTSHPSHDPPVPFATIPAAPRRRQPRQDRPASGDTMGQRPPHEAPRSPGRRPPDVSAVHADRDRPAGSLRARRPPAGARPVTGPPVSPPISIPTVNLPTVAGCPSVPGVGVTPPLAAPGREFFQLPADQPRVRSWLYRRPHEGRAGPEN